MSTERPIRVVCVDDNRLVVEAMRQVIDLDPGMECVGCFHEADHLSDEIERLRPDVLLLDMKMPGRDPVEALREVSRRFPQVRTIVCSGLSDQSAVIAAREAGACGYLEKDGNVMAMLDAIRGAGRPAREVSA